MTPLPALLALALLAPPLAAQAAAADPPADAEREVADMRLAQDLLAVLRAHDAHALAARLDGEAWAALAFRRGLLTRPWSALSPDERDDALLGAAARWVRDTGSFFHDATLADVQALPVPDPRRGPLPGRRVLRVLAARPVAGDFQELLVTVTADGAPASLRVGPVFREGEHPLGPEGLQPEPLPTLEGLQLAWPEGALRGDRDEARAWVRALDAPASAEERLEALEQIFSWPHLAAPALLEAALAWHAGADDAPREPALVAQTLGDLTGRPLELSSDVDSSAESLASWLAWLAREVDGFPPREPPAVLLAALDEQDDASLDRWQASLDARSAAAERGASADAETDDAGADDDEADDGAVADAGTPRPGSAPARDGAPVTTIPPRPIPHPVTGGPRPADDHAPGAEREPGPDAPRASVPPSDAPGPVPAALADLDVIVDGRRRDYADLHATLDAGRRELLADWADDVARLELRVGFGKRPEHVVLAAADVDLEDMTRQLDRTAELIVPRLPDLGPAPLRPTVFLLFDLDAARDRERWNALVDALLAREVLFDAAADMLRSDPGGLTLRAVPFALQPTWDMAGIAARGDDEFRLANELAHKLAACLLTNRVGQLPTGLVWAVGHFAELSLQESVYQFNRTGFVSVDDHFDWGRKAERFIDEADRDDEFTFAEHVLAAGRPDPPLRASVITWALVDTLWHEHPDTWHALLERLVAAQEQVDAFGLATLWLPDEARTRAALQAELAELDPDEVAAHADRHGW